MSTSPSDAVLAYIAAFAAGDAAAAAANPDLHRKTMPLLPMAEWQLSETNAGFQTFAACCYRRGGHRSRVITVSEAEQVGQVTQVELCNGASPRG